MSGPCLAAITLEPCGGGVAVVSRLIADVLRERWGDRLHLVTLVGGKDTHQSLTSSGAARVRFGAHMAARQIAGRCDWIFYTHASLARVQRLLPAVCSRPYGIFLHGIEVWRPLSPAQQAVLKGAALRVANSCFTARRVTALYPAIGSVTTCSLALPSDHVAEKSNHGDAALALGPRAVIVVGRMSATERYKGHDELLDAWPAVLAAVPDARLVVIGHGDDAPRLTARASASGLGASVVFTGFVPQNQMPAFYRTAAVFAMPSRGEGFGLVYLEAMAHALPCIGALDDAAGEVIEDGVTGFLVRQADREALSARIVMLLRDPALRTAMGQKGRRRVEEHFSYDRFAGRMLSLLDGAFAPAAAEVLAAARSAR